MRFLTAVFLASLVFSFYPQKTYAVEYPWQLKRDREGIVVYTRKVSGSSILEYKATVTVHAPIEKVIALFEDDQKLPQWYYQCVKFERLQDEGPGQKIFYFVIHLPWPVSERDSIFRRVKFSDAHGVVSYTLSALPEKLPFQKGKIRVLYLKSLWRFTPLADGRTEIYFQQHSDPGGVIPAFIINQLVVDIPFYSLKNFRQLLRKK